MNLKGKFMRIQSMFALAVALLMAAPAYAEGTLFEYKCKLDSKAKGGKCLVSGYFCHPEYETEREFHEDADLGIESHCRKSTMKVRCSDGFELKDRRIRTKLVNNGADALFNARHDGLKASLLIKNVHGDVNPHFDAHLVTKYDSEEAHYFGSCRIRPVENDL